MVHSEIISTTEKEKWITLVEKTPIKDIHFLPEYLSLFEKHLQSPCYLFFYGDENHYVLYPFFKRKINEITYISGKLNEMYWDIISPWYYGGPLFYGNINDNILSDSLFEFNKYCLEENIITEFSRFHPYLNNYKKMESLISLEKVGTVVWLDLTNDLEFIFNQDFQKQSRTAVRKSEKKGADVHINNVKDLKTFHKLYLKSMDAKNTRNFYYFTYDFLLNLEKNLRKEFTLITVKDKDEIVGGSIFLHKYGKMYYYLSARDPEHDEVNSLHRIIYEAIKYGKEHDLKLLDLGGGPEGSGLLRFKKSFSNNLCSLYGCKRIFDRKKYVEICKMIRMDVTDLEFENASFFPEYRR